VKGSQQKSEEVVKKEGIQQNNNAQIYIRDLHLKAQTHPDFT
jgi:hypothetical protein